jgi:GNAT superfamily N-acetyltransferase
MTGALAVEVGARSAVIDELDQIVDLAVAARESIVSARGGAVLLATDRRAGDERGQLELAMADDTVRLLVGTLDGVVVGYLLAALVSTPGGPVLAEIEELYVQPEARQVGVGAALLAPVISWATAQGCDGVDALALPGDRATKNFFESHGLVARAIIAHRSLAADPEAPG